MWGQLNKRIGPSAGKNTITHLEVWNPNALQSEPTTVESISEKLFGKWSNAGHHVPHSVFLWPKSGLFRQHFQLGEQPKMARSYLIKWRTWPPNAVFGQDSLNHTQECTGVLSRWRCLISAAHRPHHLFCKASSRWWITFRLWYGFVVCTCVHHPMEVKKKKGNITLSQHDCTPALLSFWSWEYLHSEDCTLISG